MWYRLAPAGRLIRLPGFSASLSRRRFHAGFKVRVARGAGFVQAVKGPDIVPFIAGGSYGRGVNLFALVHPAVNVNALARVSVSSHRSTLEQLVGYRAKHLQRAIRANPDAKALEYQANHRARWGPHGVASITALRSDRYGLGLWCWRSAHRFEFLNALNSHANNWRTADLNLPSTLSLFGGRYLAAEYNGRLQLGVVVGATNAQFLGFHAFAFPVTSSSFSRLLRFGFPVSCGFSKASSITSCVGGFIVNASGHPTLSVIGG